MFLRRGVYEMFSQRTVTVDESGASFMCTMKSTLTNTSQAATIYDAQWDYYGKMLASASSDSVIRLWIVANETPQVISELRGHHGPVWQVSWSHPKYGNLLASGSHDHKIIIWREEQPTVWDSIFISEEHTASVNTVQFSPWEHGLHLAAGSTDGTISILSYSIEEAFWSRKAFVAHANGVLCVSWAPAYASSTVVPQGHTPNGVYRLVSGGCDHQVRIWTYSDMSNEWILSYHLTESPHMGWVRGVAWRPVSGFNGSHVIASCSSDHTIILWQQDKENNTWKNYQVINMMEPVWSVGDAPNRMISWSLTGTILSAVSGTHSISLLKEGPQGQWSVSPLKTSGDSLTKGPEDPPEGLVKRSSSLLSDTAAPRLSEPSKPGASSVKMNPATMSRHDPTLNAFRSITTPVVENDQVRIGNEASKLPTHKTAATRYSMYRK